MKVRRLEAKIEKMKELLKDDTDYDRCFAECCNCDNITIYNTAGFCFLDKGWIYCRGDCSGTYLCGNCSMNDAEWHILLGGESCKKCCVGWDEESFATNEEFERKRRAM